MPGPFFALEGGVQLDGEVGGHELKRLKKDVPGRK
jgi:hypothetical protein